MNRQTRDALYARCGGYCEKCGWPMDQHFAVHHRKLRRHGGGHGLENLLALHHGCHNLGTHSVHLNPAAAYETGHLVRSTDDPAQVPLKLPNGESVRLDPTGSYLSEMKENHHEW